MWKSLKYLSDQQYDVMCETVFADDTTVLSHGKTKVGKLDGCGVEHLDVLMVQLLHTRMKTHTQQLITSTKPVKGWKIKPMVFTLKNPTTVSSSEASDWLRSLMRSAAEPALLLSQVKMEAEL